MVPTTATDLFVHGAVTREVGVAAMAIALLEARRGRRVAVIVDAATAASVVEHLAPAPPAMRHRLPQGSTGPDGSVDLYRRDGTATLERLVRALAPAGRQHELADGPILRGLAVSDAGAQLLVVAQWWDVTTADDADLVVVAVPPTATPDSLLAAPDGFVAFFDTPIFRALTQQGPLALVVDGAASVFTGAVARLAGRRAADDARTFLGAIAAAEEGLRDRAASIAQLLHADTTAHAVVAGPHVETMDDARMRATAIREHGVELGAVVALGLDPVPDPIADLDRRRLPTPPDPALVDLLRCHDDRVRRAGAQRARLTDIAGDAPIVEMPTLDWPPDGLAAIESLVSDVVIRR